MDIGRELQDEKVRFWTFRHAPGENTGTHDALPYVQKGLRHCYCAMQYEYEFQNARMVTQHWDVITKDGPVPGDVIFLRGTDYVYAVGHVILPRILNREHETVPLQTAYGGGNNGEFSSTGTSDKKVRRICLEANGEIIPLYLELDGEQNWGQRIDVDKWHYCCDAGVWARDDDLYVEGSSRRLCLRELKRDSASELIQKLIQNYKEENKMMVEGVELLEASKNLVLTGAPGTGKTFLAWQIACALTGDKNPFEGEEDEDDEGANFDTPHIGFCQFHPSMDYTDFVEGLRPQPPTGEGKEIQFRRKDGIFKAFCDKACKDPNANYVFIIDEINRGDISKIFGELFFAIDPGYRQPLPARGQEKRKRVKIKITTQYANLIGENDSFKDGFYVPENVYIIGTMNDIDRGVESMDFAIRRRFTWREVGPEETQDAILGNAIHEEFLRKRTQNRMDNLNNAIADDSDLGPAFQIGAAYFAKLNGEDFDALWRLNIAPLLREYLRGNERKVIEEKFELFYKEYNDETDKKKVKADSNPTEETIDEGQ